MKSKHHTLDVELFERWGSTYERSWMQQRLFDPVHSAVLHQAASRFKPARVLDIGCGSGRLLRKVHDYWPEAHLCGVDPVLRPGGCVLLAVFTSPTSLAWLLPRVLSAAQMRVLFEQAGLDVQAQPGPVARFVRITIGTKIADD